MALLYFQWATKPFQWCACTNYVIMFPNMDVISHKYYYIRKIYRRTLPQIFTFFLKIYEWFFTQDQTIERAFKLLPTVIWLFCSLNLGSKLFLTSRTYLALHEVMKRGLILTLQLIILSRSTYTVGNKTFRIFCTFTKICLYLRK